MKTTKENVSSMQIEVWRMKDKVRQDTKNMGSRAFFRYIANKSRNLLKPNEKECLPSPN